MVSPSLFHVPALPVLVTLLGVLDVHGYIPAQPSNGTAQGPGRTNTSLLHLQWYANESDWEHVARQAVGPKASDDPVQGVLVHFTEHSAGDENGTTTTPWIAFVSCDANSTLASPSGEADVFTMAKDRGAKSAILYSLHSETCVINLGYEKSVLDVFTTQTLDASRRIEYSFGQLEPFDGTYYEYFNATTLNDAAENIDKAFASDHPTPPGFLFATLSAYDANGAGLQRSANGTGTPIAPSGSSQDTGVAMIVLYAITGCVSALFCAVIISGAIRALRYPERYGPRLADPTLGGGQTRAGGLGRAILDTFPVVKFRSSGNDRESSPPRHKDIETAPMEMEAATSIPLRNSIQLARPSPTAEHDARYDAPEGAATSAAGHEAAEDNPASSRADQAGLPSQGNTAEDGEPRVPPSPREIDTRMPDCIGRETCPICIVDFEEGDDLRVLPCEGKHRFHQSCVDSWLLELSGSCPICRHDFRALETIISGQLGSDAAPGNRNSQASTSTTQNRLSRYLRFARRRQRSRDHASSPSPES